MRSNLCAFLSVLLSFSASVSAATLTPLGDLPGGDFESNAFGVSADGNTIVGFGTRNGNTEAFVAFIPEPSSFALFALGLPALVLRRRCHHRQLANHS